MALKAVGINCSVKGFGLETICSRHRYRDDSLRTNHQGLRFGYHPRRHIERRRGQW